jgi:drug/metabolite transporter (DMT)-like permease
MFLLLLVSFIWAFSFGLIKKLTGIDPTVVAVLRLVLALAVFVPFVRPSVISHRIKLQLAAIGAVQFGLMYVLYLRAFAHLQSFEVALFTITTPFFVTLIDGALQKQFVISHLGAAVLSIAGAAVIVWHGIVTSNGLIGVLLVQASNVCFAVGQVAWRQIREDLPTGASDAAVFAWPYLGAAIAAAGWSAFSTDWSAIHLTVGQAAIVVYLGVVASGVCFFWWNIGATQVNAGTLAVFNNVKIPLAVACSLLVFGEHADLRRLALGGLLIACGVWLAELTRAPKPEPAK